MRLLREDEQTDHATEPMLRMENDLNCGPDGHCAKTGVDPAEIVWAGGRKFCGDCPCNPSNNSYHAQAPEHLLA